MTEFLIVFGITGLVLIPCVLIFFIGDADKKRKIIIGAIVCAFWFLISGSIYFEAKTNTEAWNNGYCECGTHWELAGVSKSHGTGSTTKYYFCPNCYAEITQ